MPYLFQGIWDQNVGKYAGCIKVLVRCVKAPGGRDLGASKTKPLAGCQNYGPLLGTLNIRGRIIIGTPKGTIILTTKPLAEPKA